MSWGTNKEPRLEERPSAPIHLRPVTLALRAPEGTLRRRPYTTHYNYMMCTTQLKGRFCTHGNGVLRPGNFDSVASLPLLQSQSQSFKHSSRRVSSIPVVEFQTEHLFHPVGLKFPTQEIRGASLMFGSWLRHPTRGFRRDEKYVEETKNMQKKRKL